MSFDPFQEKQPHRDPPRPPLESTGVNNPDASPPISNARERVLFPAILLIIVGVVNLLVAGAFLALTAFISPAMLENAMNDPNQPEFVKQVMAQNAGKVSNEEMANQARLQYGTLGGINLVTTFLTIFAGVRMLQLRSYGLVFFGAIAAAIPCVSGSGCCCIGEVAGLYAVIMLLQSDIRDAFR